MTTIDGLTDQPVQQSSVTLPDGTRAALLLEFKPQQAGWFYSISYPLQTGETFTLNGLRLVASPNMLRQWREIIPFGLCLVASPNNLDPMAQECFVDGTAQLLLLDQVDVIEIEDQIYAGL